MNKKILITGGAGFIGGFLASALAKGDAEIHLIDNFSRGQPDQFWKQLISHKNTTVLQRDLCQVGTTDNLDDDYDLIFHFAALLGVANVIARPYQTLTDNVTLLAETIRLAKRQKKLDRFVFASTSEVYAGALLYLDLPIPTPEDVALALPDLGQPRSSYMLSKLYGEAMVQQSGLPYTIVRPHNIYGPRMGMLHVVPQLLEKIHKAPAHSSIEVQSPTHRRSFCFVDDAVAMLIACALEPACEAQILNLGNQAPEVSMRELAQMTIDIVGKDIGILEGAVAPGSPARRAPMTEKMTRLTGVTAKISLNEGLCHTYEWYQSHIFSGMEREQAR